MVSKERVIYFDVLRVLACLMVVGMHAPLSSPESVNHGIFLVANGYLNSPCVPLFFMISGALLLNKPIIISARSYLKKRITKVLFPTIVFSLLYIVLKSVVQEDYSLSYYMKSILTLPFACVTPVLWFMYVLIGLYLLVPILSPWINNAEKKDLQFYLLIWLVTQLYLFISLIIDVSITNNSIVYYFSGFVGYFVLGYYLSKHDISLKFLLPLSILFIPLPVLPKILHIDVDNTVFLSYLSFPSVVFTITCFMLFKKIANRISKFFVKISMFISPLSFGIYLCHIGVRYYFLGNCDFILNIDNYYIQYVVVLVLTFTLSLLLSYLVSLLPFGQYIIGYRKISASK